MIINASYFQSLLGAWLFIFIEAHWWHAELLIMIVISFIIWVSILLAYWGLLHHGQQALRCFALPRKSFAASWAMLILCLAFLPATEQYHDDFITWCGMIEGIADYAGIGLRNSFAEHCACWARLTLHCLTLLYYILMILRRATAIGVTCRYYFLSEVCYHWHYGLALPLTLAACRTITALESISEQHFR